MYVYVKIDVYIYIRHRIYIFNFIYVSQQYRTKMYYSEFIFVESYELIRKIFGVTDKIWTVIMTIQILIFNKNIVNSFTHLTYTTKYIRAFVEKKF